MTPSISSLIGSVLAWLSVNAAKTPSLFVNGVIDGVTLGAIDALGALGFTMIYGTLGLIHYAHGDMIVLGAMLTAVAAVDFPVALVPALVVPACPAVTGLIYVSVYRRLQARSRLAVLVASIGVAFVLKDVALVWAEATFVTFRNGPDVLPRGEITNVRGVTYGWNDLIVVVFATAVVVGLGWLLRATRIGKAVRAAADGASLANLLPNRASNEGRAMTRRGTSGQRRASVSTGSFPTPLKRERAAPNRRAALRTCERATGAACCRRPIARA